MTHCHQMHCLLASDIISTLLSLLLLLFDSYEFSQMAGYGSCRSKNELQMRGMRVWNYTRSLVYDTNALKLLFHHSDVWYWTNFARKLVGEPRGWKRRRAALSWKMEFTFAFFVHIFPFIMAPRLWLWRYHCVSDGEWHKYCTYVQNVSSDLL